MTAVIVDPERAARIRRMCLASERRQKMMPSHLAAIEKVRIAQVVQRENDRVIRIKRRVRANERRKMMYVL